MNQRRRQSKVVNRAQEIFEREGYLVLWSTVPQKIGEVAEVTESEQLIEKGTKLVVIGTVTRAEAVRYLRRNRLMEDLPFHQWPYLYKVVAE
jgi:hypothetical protein